MKRLAITLLGLAACADADGAPEPPPPPVLEAPEIAPAPLDVLVINEVAAAGDPHDWFEVVNPSSEPVVLSRFLFVDGDTLDNAAPFPDLTLAPGARHVQEVTDAGNGFKLGGGEQLRIYRAHDRGLVAQVDWDKGASPAGGSYARQPDETGAFTTVTTDTRGETNR